jgi:hypothetical protein
MPSYTSLNPRRDIYQSRRTDGPPSKLPQRVQHFCDLAEASVTLAARAAGLRDIEISPALIELSARLADNRSSRTPEIDAPTRS